MTEEEKKSNQFPLRAKEKYAMAVFEADLTL